MKGFSVHHLATSKFFFTFLVEGIFCFRKGGADWRVEINNNDIFSSSRRRLLAKPKAQETAGSNKRYKSFCLLALLIKRRWFLVLPRVYVLASSDRQRYKEVGSFYEYAACRCYCLIPTTQNIYLHAIFFF